MYCSGFRHKQSFHGTGYCRTSGCKNKHIIFDQLLTNGYMITIVFCSGVIAPYNACNTPDASVYYVVVEGIVSAAKRSPKMILCGFNTKAGHDRCFVLRNHNLCTTIYKIVTSHFNDPLGIFYGMMFIKLYMDSSILLHSGNRMGSDYFGMKTICNICNVLHDTLDIYHHGIDCAGDDGKLLLQKCSAQGYAVAL